MRISAMALGLLMAVNAWAVRDDSEGLPTPPVHNTDYPVTIHGPMTEQVCAGTVRRGWVRVGEAEDKTGSCVNGEGRNKAWLIAKLDEVPNRQALAICKVKGVPLRWYQWKTIRDRRVCGDSAPEGEDNVMIIRRGLDQP